jgi:hypothetical protein
MTLKKSIEKFTSLNLLQPSGVRAPLKAIEPLNFELKPRLSELDLFSFGCVSAGKRSRLKKI